MRFDTPANFVLIDLSKLDAASAAAFLSDQSARETPPAGCCHWLVGTQRMDRSGRGADYLRQRLEAGDRLLVSGATGADWNQLFPAEAAREQALVENGFLFLEHTPTPPSWLDTQRPLFRASPEGLWRHEGRTAVCFPWAAPGREGVSWLAPGQAILSGLPAGPWGDLLTAKGIPGTPSTSSVPVPRAKEAWHALATQRRATEGPPLRHSILHHSSEFPGLGEKEAVDFDEALGGIRKRQLVANMQGQTHLSESGLKARFSGGRLTRIESAGGTLCSGSSSYLEWGGRRHEFVVNSAFSFEGDYSWGLRQSLVLRHADLVEPGRAILDYYFVEESREFFVAVTVRWPRWNVPTTISAWAPLELELFDFPNSPLTTRSTWPDGHTSDEVHRHGGQSSLLGTDFLFSAGPSALVLGFPQNQAPRPHVLPWRTGRRWGRTTLHVTPEGGRGTFPSSDFEGMEEHFTFYLAMADGAKLPFSVTRKQAVELIPPYVSHS